MDELGPPDEASGADPGEAAELGLPDEAPGADPGEAAGTQGGRGGS